MGNLKKHIRFDWAIKIIAEATGLLEEEIEEL